MDLKTEEIVKILLILGVLYLLFNYTMSENFANLELKDIGNPAIKKFRIGFLGDNKKVYVLVGYNELKDEYRLAFGKKIHEADKVNNILLNGTSENKDINYYNNEFSAKIPLIILDKDDIDKYTIGADNLSYYIVDDSFLVQANNKVLIQLNTDLSIFVTSEFLKKSEKGFNYTLKGEVDLDENNKYLLNIKENLDKLSKIKEEKAENLRYYVISESGDIKIKWKWYQTDIPNFPIE